MLVFFVASLVAVCWWTEFDADRMAIELAVRSNEDENQEKSRSICSSELIQALLKIYGSRNYRRSSWMHPSCAFRIAAIERRLQSTA